MSLGKSSDACVRSVPALVAVTVGALPLALDACSTVARGEGEQAKGTQDQKERPSRGPCAGAPGQGGICSWLCRDPRHSSSPIVPLPCLMTELRSCNIRNSFRAEAQTGHEQQGAAGGLEEKAGLCPVLEVCVRSQGSRVAEGVAQEEGSMTSLKTTLWRFRCAVNK